MVKLKGKQVFVGCILKLVLLIHLDYLIILSPLTPSWQYNIISKSNWQITFPKYWYVLQDPSSGSPLNSLLDYCISGAHVPEEFHWHYSSIMNPKLGDELFFSGCIAVLCFIVGNNQKIPLICQSTNRRLCILINTTAVLVCAPQPLRPTREPQLLQKDECML